MLADGCAHPTPRKSQSRERTCIASGETAAPARMLRFVLAPDGSIRVDLSQKLPGRGAWVAARKSAVTRAFEKGLFARGFKTKTPRLSAVEIEAALNDIMAGLQARTLAAAGLARRSGDLVIGGDAAVKALKAGQAQIAISTTDAGARMTADVRQAAASANARWLSVLTIDTLSDALGINGVQHIAVNRGRSASRLGEEAMRLAGITDETMVSSAMAEETEEKV